MKKDSGKTLNDQKLEYEIVENEVNDKGETISGYRIFLGGKLWITQYNQYSRVIIPDGSYEDNALAQIDELTAPAPEPEPTPVQFDVEKLRSDMDYLAAMTGFELPSASEV